jgi:hypothetical protein
VKLIRTFTGGASKHRHVITRYFSKQMDISATCNQTYSPEVEAEPNGPELCSPTRKHSRRKINGSKVFRTVEAMT